MSSKDILYAYMNLHETQQKILLISRDHDITNLSLRKLGKLIGIDHPQKVKYHLEELRRKGYFIKHNKNSLYKNINQFPNSFNNIIEIPLLGSANCGIPTLIASNELVTYLSVSKSILYKTHDIFALRAVGDSMNNSKINGESIEDGDYVIVYTQEKTINNGDYIVSIIDNSANIKKIYKDKQNKRIVLISESDREYPPIIIDQTEIDNYLVSGKVIQVIKKIILPQKLK